MAVARAFIRFVRSNFTLISRKRFVRSVGVLAGGTAVAQAVMLLVLPLLTRLYTPDDFSVLAVYVSVVAIISVASCLRLEIAIPIPESDRDAANLLALALCCSMGISSFVGAVVLLFAGEFSGSVGAEELRQYVWLIPLGIWLSSSYAALQYWTIRKERFHSIAGSKLTQAVGGSSTQAGLGWASVAPFGLLLGHMISSGAGVFNLARLALRHDRETLRSIRWHQMRCQFKQYQQFPKFSTVESLINTAGSQLPIVIIAAIAAGPEAGFLILAMRTMQAPLTLLGGAVGQVYLSRAPHELRAANLGFFTAQVLAGLAKVGLGPLLFVGLIAPVLFAVVFGERWRPAGELVGWMTPWFMLQFLASPISMVMHVRGRQLAMLVTTFAGLLTRVGAVGAVGIINRDYLSETFALSSAVFYLGCIAIFSRVSDISTRDMLTVFRRAAPIVFVWGCVGILCRVWLGN